MIEKIVDYKIAKKPVSRDLETEVYVWIQQGYEPIGAAFECKDGYWCQTMVKKASVQ